MITVSCIIPTLGERPEMLQNAIDSATRQTVPFKEIIIEKTPGRENPDNQAIKINQGIEKSTADAYIFMGDDDELKDNLVEVMAKVMDETGADIVSSMFENFGDEVGVHGPRLYPLCSTIVRKSLWEKVGGFPLDAGPGVDALFYLRCFDENPRWVKLGEVLYRTRVHKDQFSHVGDWELTKAKKKELFGSRYDYV